jgi:hypothetical protein
VFGKEFSPKLLLLAVKSIVLDNIFFLKIPWGVAGSLAPYRSFSKALKHHIYKKKKE